jgi:hypothetical protein
MLKRSILVAGETRHGWLGSLAARLALIGAGVLAAAGRVDASPYTVTDLGDWFNVHRDGTGDYYTNVKTGASYAFFTTPPDDITSEQQASLPTATATVYGPGPSFPPATVKLQGCLINDSGTVLGYITTSIDYNSGKELTGAFGYAARSPDGQYSSFVPVSDRVHNPNETNDLYLSQANQILVNDSNGTRLADVNTGTITPIAQLMPSQILEKFPLGFGGFDIDDRGDILVEAIGLGGMTEALMLTPPGLAPPAVPEPSTLLIFAAAGALAIRAGRRPLDQSKPTSGDS